MYVAKVVILFIKHIIDHYPHYAKLLHSTDNVSTLPIHFACSGVIQVVTFLIDVIM